MIATIPGLGTFEFDYATTSHPTPDPGGDPWIVEIGTVWWLLDGSALAKEMGLGVEVNIHALWHRMPDGRCLSEVLEFYVYDNVGYDPDDYYVDADYYG